MGVVAFAPLWGAFLTAFFMALVLTPVARWLAPKVGAMDIPKDERKIHSKPIPRNGGMAIFCGTMTAVAVFVLPQISDSRSCIGILAGALVIFAFGLIDDLKEMRPIVKLAGQVAAACVAFGFGIRVEFIGQYVGLEKVDFGNVLSLLVTVLWIVGIINAVNLIDGMDGLAAGIAAIASLCIAYVPYIHGQYLVSTAMLAVGGGALGFLPHNFHPAKIFMGDSGSQFLGFCLATFALIGPSPVKGTTMVALLIPASILGLPIFDTVFAVIRRIINRQPVASGDKEHLHHRIMRIGFGQRRSVMLMYGISGILGVMAVSYDRHHYVECVGLLAIASMLLYVLFFDPSMKNVQIHAVNIRQEEEREEWAKKEHKGKKDAKVETQKQRKIATKREKKKP